MGTFRKLVKNVVEGLTGLEIERFGSKSFALIDTEQRRDAWFSYHAQLRSIIEKLEINAVIDVGANEGQFAKKLRSFYFGEIHSFEPVTLAFEKLAEAASPDPKWHVYKLALGSQESTQTINVSDETVFSSLLRTNDYCVQRFGRTAQGKREELVSIRRLDELLDKMVPNIENKRVFLKMDTQGYDMEVFKGLGNKLKHVTALQSEISLISIYEGMPHWTESVSAYEQAGFGVVGMFPVTQDKGRIIEYDCLLVRVEPI
ncbi:MAG: FkbM family methyltransferase [Nitrospira sp.]|nr:FkbM family methyltransferase [Nitrospira sp.]MBH0181186.1 FkbM family methyltransferase [Nitrospira sp.]MBH0184905.1 FkbM family methyltransferase [Nitrospira sp.]